MHGEDGTRSGMVRLAEANRLWIGKKQLRFKAYRSDFGLRRLSNFWSGLGGPKDPVYVVQTNTRVIERCLLMTTDPGDLVLDPTCGSGTTAYAAEQWGRRWITIDTSRVALTLAKHRLMTAKYDYYRLRELNADDVARNPDGTWIAGLDDAGRPTGARLTFDCRTAPHVTLRSIARNTSLDPIFARHEPILDEALAALNREAAAIAPETKRKLAEKLVARHRGEGAQAVTDADARRWLLPAADPAWVTPVAARKPLKALTLKQAEKYRARIPQGEWKDWQPPFDTDPDWPAPLRASGRSWRKRSAARGWWTRARSTP